ncbi:MAG: TonB-dependent receptor [Sandaracinobacter sp.]
MVRKAKGWILAGAALLPALPVVAQDIANDPLGLDTIVVTAQRRAEGIQDVPIAISAFDQRAIERLNGRDIRDLAGLVPNLVVSEVAIGPSLSQISIRGVNSQDPEKSFDPAVGVFVDGVYLGTSAFNLLDTFDLERLEVLRGPQGTLFGRNTTGGAIQAFRTKPTGELGVRGRVIFGTANRRDLNAVVNLPSINDTVSVKLSGYLQRDDGLWENAAGGATGAKDRWGLTGTVMLRAGPGELLVTYDHFRDDSELTPYFQRGIATIDPLPYRLTGTPPVPATITPAFGPDLLCLRGTPQLDCDNPADRRSRVTDPHFQNSRLDALTVNGNLKLSDKFALETVFGWRQSSEDVYIDFDGTQRTVFNVFRTQDFNQMSAEARIVSSLPGPIQFVTGVFWFGSQYSLRQAIKLDLAMVGAPVPLGNLYLNGSGDEDFHRAETTAIYAQADWGITSDLTLTLGGRASWDKKNITTRFYGAALPPTAPYSILDGVLPGRPLTSSGTASADWFEFTPRAAINWKPTDEILVYASYSRGYNAGGFSARAGTVRDVTTPFNPEFVNAYELGGKADFLDGRLRLNGALFWNDYTDKQEEVIEPAPPPAITSTTVRNAASARLRGFELEMNAVPLEWFRLDASLGYLDARYRDFDTFASTSQFVSVPPQPAGTLIAADFSPNRLRRAPEWTASISPTFFWSFDKLNLSINGLARHLSSQVSEVLNSQRGVIPATWLYDVAATVTFGGPDNDRYRVILFGRNLSDERPISSFTNAVVDFSTNTPGRTWGLELTLDF